MVNKSFLVKTSYFSDCDLIYKYRLKSVYDKPKIDKIFLDFPISNISNQLETINLVNSQLLHYVLIYSLFSILPFINCQKLKNSIRGEKTIDIFSLKLIFKDNTSKYNFLRTFLIEAWSNVVKEELNLFSKNIKLKKINTSKQHNFFTASFPIFLFDEIDPLFLNFFSKETLLNITFNTTQAKTLEHLNYGSLIENLPLFWITGLRLR
jgi:hypothetical protein